MSAPDFACPVCGVVSRLVIGETQALCTNVTGSCLVIFFNPSLPDGGMADAETIDVGPPLGIYGSPEQP